jgi:hypothetical protein
MHPRDKYTTDQAFLLNMLQGFAFISYQTPPTDNISNR